MRIWLLDNGSIVIEHTQLMWNVPGPQVRIPSYGVLVEHDDGLVLFDTGFDLEHTNRVLPFELPEQTPEQTIPAHSPPAPIALLRLDTDWYESTKHEMVHLFPLLREGGVLIVDDYGHWQGARKAIDEYLAEHARREYLRRIDYTGRLLVKQ